MVAFKTCKGKAGQKTKRILVQDGNLCIRQHHLSVHRSFIATQPSPHDRRFRFLAPFGSFSHSRPAVGALREHAMIVSVTRDDRYFFGGSIIMPEELPGLINSGLKGGAERKVYLSVDGRVKYWDLSVALEQIKLSGLQDVCFLVH